MSTLITSEQAIVLSSQLQSLLQRLDSAQFPTEWRVGSGPSPVRSSESCQRRVALTDRLPEGSNRVLDTDDEADDKLLEGRSDDEYEDEDGNIVRDTGSDLFDFIVPDEDDDDDAEVDGDVVMKQVSDSDDSGSDSDDSDDSDVEDAEIEDVVEPVDIEMDGIDPTNIQEGRRTRRAVMQYIPDNYAKLMLRADDSIEGPEDDSEDSDDSDDSDDSEDEEEVERCTACLEAQPEFCPDECVCECHPPLDVEDSDYESEDSDAEDEIVIHKTPSKRRQITVESDDE